MRNCSPSLSWMNASCTDGHWLWLPLIYMSTQCITGILSRSHIGNNAGQYVSLEPCATLVVQGNDCSATGLSAVTRMGQIQVEGTSYRYLGLVRFPIRTVTSEMVLSETCKAAAKALIFFSILTPLVWECNKLNQFWWVQMSSFVFSKQITNSPIDSQQSTGTENFSWKLFGFSKR